MSRFVALFGRGYIVCSVCCITEAKVEVFVAVCVVDVTAAVRLVSRIKSAVSNKCCVHSRSKFGSILAEKLSEHDRTIDKEKPNHVSRDVKNLVTCGPQGIMGKFVSRDFSRPLERLVDFFAENLHGTFAENLRKDIFQ